MSELGGTEATFRDHASQGGKAPIELPAKYSKHAKTEAKMRVRDALWLHPTSERRSQRRAGFDAVALGAFSEFGGPVLTNGYKSTAAFGVQCCCLTVSIQGRTLPNFYTIRRSPGQKSPILFIWHSSCSKLGLLDSMLNPDAAGAVAPKRFWYGARCCSRRAVALDTCA